MPKHREPRGPWIVAGYIVLFAVVAAIAGFIHDAVAPAHRPVVIRLAVAFVVALIVVHLRIWFRGDPRWEPPSEFEDALTPQPAGPKIDASFARLREQVGNGIVGWSYFEKVLWPRLQILARLRGRENELALPAGRGWPGRGPSLRAISDLVDQIERRR